MHRLGDAAHGERPQIAQAEVAGHEPRRVLRQVGRPRLGELLHPLRETDRVALRRVVHAEIVADPADDHLARVETHAHREVEPLAQPELVRVAPELARQVERRIARPARMVLVRDRCAEERHDAVARELIDRALETVHALGEEGEEAVHDAMPGFGVDALGELHRTLHVGEEDRHLLALALEGGLRGKNLLGEVLGRIGAGGTLCRARRLSQALAAAVAELVAHRIRLAAAGARHVTGQARAALATEAGAVGIRVVAAGAFHRTHQLAARLLPLGQPTGQRRAHHHGRARAASHRSPAAPGPRRARGRVTGLA